MKNKTSPFKAIIKGLAIFLYDILLFALFIPLGIIHLLIAMVIRFFSSAPLKDPEEEDDREYDQKSLSPKTIYFRLFVPFWSGLYKYTLHIIIAAIRGIVLFFVSIPITFIHLTYIIIKYMIIGISRFIKNPDKENTNKIEKPVRGQSEILDDYIIHICSYFYNVYIIRILRRFYVKVYVKTIDVYFWVLIKYIALTALFVISLPVGFVHLIISLFMMTQAENQSDLWHLPIKRKNTVSKTGTEEPGIFTRLFRFLRLNRFLSAYGQYYNHTFIKAVQTVVYVILFVFTVVIQIVYLIIWGMIRIIRWIPRLLKITKPKPAAGTVKINKPDNGFIRFVKIIFFKQGNKSQPRYYTRYFIENREETQRLGQALIYLSPALVLIAIFLVYPLFFTFITSFKNNYNYMPVKGQPKFTGWTFQYYLNLLKTDNFYSHYSKNYFVNIWTDYTGFFRPIFNTFIIAFVSVPLSIIISLLIAVALNSIKKLQGLFQTIFFLPYVTNVIAISLVFKIIFSQGKLIKGKYQNPGLINSIFHVHISWIDTKASTFHILFVVIVYSIWSALPFKIMVFLAGIQGIDKQYYQAAQVDGAPRRRVFWRITVPLLSPFILYITITSFIGAFKAYSEIVALFPNPKLYGGVVGNPGAAQTIVYYIYGFISNGKITTPGNISQASAASIALFVIILLFTLVQMKVSAKRVHY